MLPNRFRRAHPAALRSSPHPVRVAGWGLVLLALASGATELQGQGTRAGTHIHSLVQVSYLDQDGVFHALTAEAEGGDFVVAQVGGVDVDPPGASTADPGNTLVFRHT